MRHIYSDLPYLQDKYKGLNHTGKFNVFKYIEADNEKVLNFGDSWLVFGMDRVSGIDTGYGSFESLSAYSSLDIVVGRYKSVGLDKWVNPDFKRDAGRIHVSATTDIDDNFEIPKSQSYKRGSAIGLKADSVRIVGGEGGVKIVSNIYSKTSEGKEAVVRSPIILQSGGDEDNIESLVKGERLVEAFEKILEQIDNLANIVDEMNQIQMEFNEKLSQHYHYSPFFGQPTTPSQDALSGGITAVTKQLIKTKKNIVLIKTNLVNLKINYVEPFGGKYILSRFNKLD